MRFFLAICIYACTILLQVAVSQNAAAQQNRIYVKRAAIWTIQQIPVCWENPTNTDAQERGWVQNVVASTWQASSSIVFTGWGPCSNASKGVRIRIAESNPHTKALGSELDGHKDGMELNFTFATFSKNFCQANVPGRREHCIRVVALHEFGHALGFSHEQNRADAPEWCQQERQGENGDVMVTDFDINSVMNYCNNSSWPAIPQLSAFDVIGLQRVYGVPGGPLPAPGAIFAVNLTALHPGCNAEGKSRTPDCMSAIHRVCSGAGRGGAGIPQEVGRGAFGVACFQPSWYGDVQVSDLKARHPGCTGGANSQSPECLSAIHRWCLETGHGTAGVAQELGPTVFGVACFNASWYGDVRVPSLRALHQNCSNASASQSSDCTAAIHRWCVSNKQGQAGIAQEVGPDVLGVACLRASWYGDVALH